MKTVNLELAKQLKELGYPQEGEFKWYTHDYKEDDAWATNDPGEYATFGDDPIAIAPTADEILDQLPWTVNGGGLYIEKYTKDYDRWGIGYKAIRNKKDVLIVVDKTKLPYYSLADAAAKMWLYLKKEELI